MRILWRIFRNHRSKDFRVKPWYGFYTATDFEQAKKWALIQKDRFHYEKAIVSEFELDSVVFKTNELKIKIFHEADEEWLDFVVSNRQNQFFFYDYDLVMGAVANDNVYTSLNLYEEGFLNKKELLRELMAWKYVDQICFHTRRRGWPGLCRRPGSCPAPPLRRG